MLDTAEVASGAGGARWRLAPGQLLQHRAWDEVVLYNNLSGDTHLLSLDSLDTLLALQAAPLAEADLIAVLAGDEPADAAFADAVRAVLAELQKLTLVEAC